MAEKNKEMIRLIGRRLREATAAADGKLPPSISDGLERLSELELGGDAAGEPQLIQEAATAAQPAAE